MKQRRAAATVITTIASAAAVAAAMPAHAAPRHSHQPAGLYVAKEGLASRGNQPAAFVYDEKGGEHVITMSPASTGKGNIVYRTKPSGAKKWTSHVVPGVRPLKFLHIEAHISDDYRRLFVALYQCNGVYAVDAPLSAHRLPEPVLVHAESNCGTGATDPYAPTAGLPVQRAAAWGYTGGGASGDTMAVLLYDATDMRPHTTTPVGWTLYAGAPALSSKGTPSFTSRGPILPAGSKLLPEQLTIDSYTNHPTVIATGSNGVNQAVFAIQGTSLLSQWQLPTQIASLGRAGTNYTVESSISYRHRVFVGLLRPGSSATTTSLYLVKSSSGGTWSGAFRLPHTGQHDSNLLIAKNIQTNNLHAVFTRNGGGHVGLMAEMQPKSGGWTKPAAFSSSKKDRAIALYVTSHGRNVIAYHHS